MFRKENGELFDMTRSDIERLQASLKKIERGAGNLIAQIKKGRLVLENSKSTKEFPLTDDYYDIVEQLMSQTSSFSDSDAIKEVGNVVADVMTQNVNGNGEYDEFRR